MEIYQKYVPDKLLKHYIVGKTIKLSLFIVIFTVGFFRWWKVRRRGKIMRQQQFKICHDYARNLGINLANKKITSLEN